MEQILCIVLSSKLFHHIRTDMGILQNALGINATNLNPLTNSPFNNSDNSEAPFVPTPSEFMITEGGLFMLTETSLAFMITE